MGTRAPAPLALALLLAACTTGGTDVPRDAEPVPVPAASPAGAAYGRLMDADGRSVPGGSVTLTQPFDDNVVTISLQLVSLGLFCLIPDSGICPTAHGADLTDNGLWSIGSEDVEPDKVLRLGGEGPSGALAAVALPNGTAPVHVPDLVLWEPTLTLDHTRAGTRVSWPELAGVPQGKARTYTVFATVGDPTFARPVEIAHGLRRTSAVVPDWQTEDQPFTVSVVASSRKGDRAFTYTSPPASGVGTAVPLSRGHACTSAEHGCPLTDGVLDSHVEVGKTTLHRICVDLGTPQTVRRVVVRTPFGAVDRVVELSRDGRQFTTRGRLADANGEESGVFDVPVRPATTARFACVRSDDFGFAGAILSEISVW